MEGKKKKKERKREEKNGRTFSRDLDTAPKLEDDDDDDDDTPSVSFRPPRSFDHGGLDCLIVPPLINATAPCNFAKIAVETVFYGTFGAK